MSQRPWVKAWTCALADPHWEPLSWALKGMWVELLLLVAAHGDQGVWHLAEGLVRLPGRWRKGRTYLDLSDTFAHLPGVSLTPDPPPSPGVTIAFTNWYKYQVDSSAERMRRHRERTVTRNGDVPSPVTPVEKRRGDKTPQTPRSGLLDHGLKPHPGCNHSPWDAVGPECSEAHRHAAALVAPPNGAHLTDRDKIHAKLAAQRPEGP